MSQARDRERRVQEAIRLHRAGTQKLQIAQALNVSVRTVDQYLADGEAPPVAEESSVYGLVIYQNQEYVSALLQQLFSMGLPVEQYAELLNQAAQQSATEGGGQFEASGGFKFPLFPLKAQARAGGSASRAESDSGSNEHRDQKKFVYTQANYLHNVREALDQRHLIRRITSQAPLASLEPGTFVEFSARFQPNEVNSLLDLATPELVAAITKYQHKKDALEKFDFEEGGIDARQAFALRVDIEAESKAALAAAAVEAVRQDFRNDSTREFFGEISGTGITAVTICDTEFFVNRDRDRILDGEFKVLGKVSEVLHEETSILSRNKVLNRLQQPLVDEFLEEMLDASREDQFDMSLNLNMNPPILKVIPIAVYL